MLKPYMGYSYSCRAEEGELPLLYANHEITKAQRDEAIEYYKGGCQE